MTVRGGLRTGVGTYAELARRWWQSGLCAKAYIVASRGSPCRGTSVGSSSEGDIVNMGKEAMLPPKVHVKNTDMRC